MEKVVVKSFMIRLGDSPHQNAVAQATDKL
jgi:hypothetical protein